MNQLKFLIVDDNVRNRLLLSEIIDAIGHQFVMAENGEVAINILEKEKIDIILMDIEMPKMNGFETTQHIRNQMKSPIKNIPIIAITAHNIDEYSSTLLNSGFNEIISKPYSFEKLNTILLKYISNG